MKALVKARAEPGIWMQDVPEPAVGHNDVLIKVHRSAICGTDMHIYNWDAWAQKTVPVPMAVGHEYAGEIVELGSEVRGFSTGDRVSGEGHITCGHCRNCRAGRRHLCRNTSSVGVNRAGAFAEYLTIPASNVFKLPNAIDDEIASILDPFGNATHTALAFNVVGEDVLITGAGPIGIMAVAVARHCGARHIVITDVNDYRLELAAAMGASKTLNVSRQSLDDAMRDLGMEEGFDVGFEMSGNAAALREMLRTMNHGGSISMLGIPPGDVAIDWNQVIFKGLVIKGIYGREMFETWYKMTAMLQSGLDVTPVITHRFAIDDYTAGFETMLSGQSGKVILERIMANRLTLLLGAVAAAVFGCVGLLLTGLVGAGGRSSPWVGWPMLAFGAAVLIATVRQLLWPVPVVEVTSRGVRLRIRTPMSRSGFLFVPWSHLRAVIVTQVATPHGGRQYSIDFK